MSYITRWRKRKAEVDKLLVMNASDSEIEAAIKTATETLVEKTTIESPHNTSLAEELHDLSHCSSYDVSDQLHEYCSSEIESSESVMSHDERVNDINFQPQLKAWAIKSRCTRASLNDLLNILSKKHPYLPKDCRTLLHTPRTVNYDQNCGGSYIYFGIENGINTCLNMLTNHFIPTDSINLHYNIDGLPLHKSTSSQFWPFLGTFDGANIFIICLFYGTSKPEPIHDYLSGFMKEMKTLLYFHHQGKNIKVNLRCFICDAPVRSFLKSTINHTGYSSCERSMIKGCWNRRFVFNDDDVFPQRTDADFNQMKYDDHQKGESQLLQIQFNCVSGFVLDYMHLVCLGVMKRLLNILKKGPGKCCLSNGLISQISDGLLLLKNKIPTNFARQPRSLTELDRWKATEFPEFLLYTGAVVLRDVLSKPQYEHF